jgi:RNA polymerase sigma factor (sigma-70 family)
VDAFLEVYESSFDALYRYIFSRIGNHDDTNDIVSDAFLRVFHRYQHVTSSEQLRRLLFVTARNLVIDRSRHIQTVTLPMDCPSGEGQDAVAETVQDALAALEPDERDLIALKYFSRLTFHEMSEIMGISERMVQSRLRTVLQKMRVNVAQEEYHE